MLRGLFGRREPGDAVDAARAARGRIANETRAILGLSETATVTVSEIVCRDPACPGVETFILVGEAACATRAYKVVGPASTIDPDTLREALGAATSSAGETA